MIRVAELFGPECVVEQAVPELVDAELYPEERAFIRAAVPKRRAEFGTARLLARRALARLGAAPIALVPHEDRAPRWPQGVVGSITHTDGYCAVVAASASKLQSVGLDAERDKPLASDLVQMICTPAEQRHVTERDAVVYFAAKEAFYKCQYPLTRQFLDFQDVTLTVDLTCGTFRVQLHKPLPRLDAWLAATQGRFLREQGLVVCGISMPHGS